MVGLGIVITFEGGQESGSGVVRGIAHRRGMLEDDIMSPWSRYVITALPFLHRGMKWELSSHMVIMRGSAGEPFGGERSCYLPHSLSEGPDA